MSGRGRAPVQRIAGASLAQTMSLSRRLVDVETGRDVMRFLRRGLRVNLVLELVDSAQHEYVALDCPLPAGFEVLGSPQGWEVHDDRAVYAFRSTGGRSRSVVLPLLVPFAGEVAWQPATAVAVYDERQRAYAGADRLVLLDH